MPEEALSQLLGEYMGSVPSDLSALQGYEQLQQLLQRPDLRVRGRQGGAANAPRVAVRQCTQGRVSLPICSVVRGRQWDLQPRCVCSILSVVFHNISPLAHTSPLTR